ncbi:histone-lysine N-methyltransferase 2D-like [Colius striatus]|uniref:histone-lysine N-methyltransferase 2D-like n=1 Tax=Colius striatus TaxID=57412 RepID=UPI002B1D22BB|nr:histone-lysine N-methyltransferase 2D-like [Colius striatus]
MVTLGLFELLDAAISVPKCTFDLVTLHRLLRAILLQLGPSAQEQLEGQLWQRADERQGLSAEAAPCPPAAQAAAVPQHVLTEADREQAAQSHVPEYSREKKKLQDSVDGLYSFMTSLDSDVQKLKDWLSLYPSPEEVRNMIQWMEAGPLSDKAGGDRGRQGVPVEGAQSQSGLAKPPTLDTDTMPGAGSALGLREAETQPVPGTSQGTSKGTPRTQPGSLGMPSGMQGPPMTPEKEAGAAAGQMVSDISIQGEQPGMPDTRTTTLWAQPPSPSVQTSTLGAQPPSPGVQTSTLGAQPPSPSSQTSTLGAQPSSPDTQTTTLRAQPPSPGVQTSTLGAQPSSPNTETSTLGAQLPSPSSQTSTLGSQPPSPNTETSTLGAQSPSPDTQTTTLGAQPPSPSSKTTTLRAQPPSPSSQTTTLGGQPPSPDTQTTTLGAQPPSPNTETSTLGAQTPSPDSQTTTLGAQPSSPNTQISTLGAQRPSPDTQTTTLGTQPPSPSSQTSTLAGQSSSPDTQTTTLGPQTPSPDTQTTTLGPQTPSPDTQTTTLGAQTAPPRGAVLDTETSYPGQESSVFWRSSGSSSPLDLYPEIVEALQRVEKLSNLYGALEKEMAQLQATKLDSQVRDQESNGRILAELQAKVSSLQGLGSDLQDEKGKIRQLEEALGKLEVAGTEWKADLSNQITLQLKSRLREVKQELRELREEQKRFATVGQLQEQLAQLRAMTESAGQERAEAQVAQPGGRSDLSAQLEQLFQHLEKMQEQVDSLILQQPLGKMERQLPGKSQDEELLRRMQDDIVQLQAACKETRSFMGNLQQKEEMQAVFQALERLEEEKADKEDLLGIDVKGYKAALASKVSCTQFDATMERLEETMQDVLSRVTQQEQGCQQLQQQLAEGMEAKVDRLQLEAFWKQLEQQQPHAHLHCLSCDRPLYMCVPGP